MGAPSARPIRAAKPSMKSSWVRPPAESMPISVISTRTGSGRRPTKRCSSDITAKTIHSYHGRNNVGYGQGTVQFFRNLESYGNTFVQPSNGSIAYRVNSSPTIGALPVQSGLGVDHNTYYDTDATHPFLWDDTFTLHSYASVSAWHAGTGYDANSTLLPYASTPTMATCHAEHARADRALADAPRLRLRLQLRRRSRP